MVPHGSNHLLVILEICGDRYELSASSVMSGQFSQFVKALFSLYQEPRDPHRCFGNDVRINWKLPTEDQSLKKGEVRVTASFHWDGEGSLSFFYFSRIRTEGSEDGYPQNDPIRFTIRWTLRHDGPRDTYVVEGRDLCYAVAKAVTDYWKTVTIAGKATRSIFSSSFF